MSFIADDLRDLFESNDHQKVKNLGGVSAICKNLNSDPEKGLAQKSVAHNLATFGANTIPDRPIPSFFEMLKDALSDQTLIILIICAIVSLVLELFFAPPEERSTAWIDGTAILAAVAIVSFVQAYSNHKQEIQFSAVNRVKSIFNTTVVRDSKIMQIKNLDIVVGDLIDVEQGDKIPADCLLLSSMESTLRIDQSAATGESEAVNKDVEIDPFLISNTHVTEGRGRLLVICVGTNSHHGRVFELLANEEHGQTPLQEKLEVLAAKIGGMGVFVASLTFVVLLLEWIYRCFHSNEHWKWENLREPLSYFIVAITIIACAVPEGLPLAVTISLAYSMRRMMKDNNFVRHLNACETMGSATVICTDKTGTLTQNQMNCEEVIIGPTIEKIDFIRNVDGIFATLLKRNCAINSHAVISEGNEIGSQTECSLVRLVSFLRGNTNKLRKRSKIVKCFDFDRNRKKMSTIEIDPTENNNRNNKNDTNNNEINDNNDVNNNQSSNSTNNNDNNSNKNNLVEDGSYLIHVKGAPDEIIPFCSQLYLDTNTIVNMTDEYSQQLQQKVEEECSKSYRTLALAVKRCSSIPNSPEETESNLILLCVLCIRDSLRTNTVKSIEKCQRAGIRVIMVTGDHMITAEAIARECHILTPDKIAVTGSTLRSMSKEELRDQLPLIAVVARSTPLDKHLLVSSLQDLGEVVGVTGDGTNDVAALMAADVGLSMGKCGTELAKEASDIVVLDDDFKSIVRAVVWGRCIFNNIQRFLQFQLTANVSTLFISFISAVILSETPFKAVQLLWVNLIMDSLGALSLATGNPHDNLLEHKPTNKDSPLITKFMIINIGGQALLQIILIGSILIFPGGFEKYSQHHYTFLFNVFVLSQALNLLNARVTERGDDVFLGVFDTPLFFGIMVGIIVVQWGLVQIAGQFFSCTPLSGKEWAASLALAGLSFPMGWLLRHVGPSGQKFGIYKNRNREDVEPLLN